MVIFTNKEAQWVWDYNLDLQSRRTIAELGFDEKTLQDTLIQQQITEMIYDSFEDFDEPLQTEIRKIMTMLQSSQNFSSGRINQ